MGRIDDESDNDRCISLDLVACEGQSKRTAELNDGRVAFASSFASMEQVAREHDTKGVIWERHAHSLQEDMEQWVAGQQESIGCFSGEQLFIGTETRGQDASNLRPSKRAKLLSTMPDVERQRDVDESVQVACERVVAKLPPALRGPMSDDARALAELLMRLCPGTEAWLTIQVEIVGALGACSRWHQDRYIGRAIITYAGEGTWCVDDASVRYDQFAQTYGMPMEESDARIVPEPGCIHMPTPNAVVLMKGNEWPGIRGVGLTHRAPDVRCSADGEPEIKRLVLKADLAAKRPPIAVEDEE